MSRPAKVTLVIPVFNEGASIRENLLVIRGYASDLDSVEASLLIVDDGSIDDTASYVRTLCDAYEDIRLLSLNRNFGKEGAILAGLDYADGDAAIVMDSDLQHPPELIPRMVKIWKSGIDVVEARKSNRGRENLLYSLSARSFYRLFFLCTGMNISDNTDFKLLDRKVIDAYLALPERKRFFRGLIDWMGFPSARVFFNVTPRQGGQSTWSALKLFRLSITALTAFSAAPLYLITLMGGICLSISVIFGSIAVYHKITGVAVSGFTTVILLILLIGSFLMIGIGMLSIYVEQLFDEIKRRPTYLINERKSRLNRRMP